MSVSKYFPPGLDAPVNQKFSFWLAENTVFIMLSVKNPNMN